jgi:hypothetical protein
MSHLFYHPSLDEFAVASTGAYYPKLTARSLSNVKMVHRSDPPLHIRYNVFQARVVVPASTRYEDVRLISLLTREIYS